jgi:phosphoribosylglycinamide formyltransferase-1
MTIRLGILGSTRGTHLQPLAKAIQQQRLPATIEIVISNKPDALILQRAIQHGLPAQYVNPTACQREQYDQILSQLLRSYQVNLVILIGYMRILSVAFIAAWKNKVINTHPSLLPAFAGKMDLAVHHAVLASGIKESGCTVHYVTEEVDAGPILLQKRCPVLADDTPNTLKARVQQLEAETLIEAISLIACSSQRCETTQGLVG